MIVDHFQHMEAKPVIHPEARDAAMRVLINPENGWDGHVMRVIELQEGGCAPKHAHPWPHINYILEGVGVLFMDGVEYKLQSGSFCYVPDNALHQFINAGSGTFRFICIVPERGHI